MKKNVFVLPSRLGVNVIESQVLSLMKDSDYIIYTGDRLNPSNFKNRNKITIRDYIKLAKTNSINKVYVRDCFDFILFYFLRLVLGFKVSIFYDFRALVFHEMKYQGKNRLKVGIVRSIEKFCYRFSDEVGAVSNNLKREIVNQFKISRQVTVFPCCFNKIAKRDRPYGNRLLYAGGLSPWQNFEQVVNTYIKLKELDDSFSLTVITLDQVNARNICEKFNAEDVTIKSLKHNDVFNEIKKHDFGFILRDDSIINKVSSPIKVAEYLCSGLIPIVSGSVGDFSSIFETSKLAVFYSEDTEEILEQIKCIKNRDLLKLSSDLYKLAQSYNWDYTDRTHGINLSTSHDI